MRDQRWKLGDPVRKWRDANGNSLRYRGKYQQPSAALWTPLNRMRAFIEGDPTLGSAYPNESYQYDNSGYGIVKIDDTGKPVITAGALIFFWR